METQTGQAKGGGNLKASTGWVTTAFQPERGARPRRGVLRGGSFNNNWNNVRVANRNNNNPNNSNNNIGFRIAFSSRKGWMSVHEQIIFPDPNTNWDK